MQPQHGRNQVAAECLGENVKTEWLLVQCCRHAVTWEPLNLDHLKEAVEKGLLQEGSVVTMKTLYDAGLLSKKIEHGVKLLGNVCIAPSSLPHPFISPEFWIGQPCPLTTHLHVL